MGDYQPPDTRAAAPRRWPWPPLERYPRSDERCPLDTAFRSTVAGLTGEIPSVPDLPSKIPAVVA